MKKHIIIGMALGILTIGALSASAAGTGQYMAACADKQAYQQFNAETSGLTSTLNAKLTELKDLNYAEGYDFRKANELEKEVKELKGKINTAAQKIGIPACNHS